MNKQGKLLLKIYLVASILAGCEWMDTGKGWQTFQFLEYTQNKFWVSSEAPDVSGHSQVVGILGTFGGYRLFDDDTTTYWAEGEKDFGKDVTIEFAVPKGIRQIEIWNGNQQSDSLFHAYNRVKGFEASLFAALHHPEINGKTEVAKIYEGISMADTWMIMLEDISGPQGWDLPVSVDDQERLIDMATNAYQQKYGKALLKTGGGIQDAEVVLVLRLTLTSAFTGDRVPVTCVSEIGAVVE
jgi:hypothetical protein